MLCAWIKSSTVWKTRWAKQSWARKIPLLWTTILSTIRMSWSGFIATFEEEHENVLQTPWQRVFEKQEELFLEFLWWT